MGETAPLRLRFAPAPPLSSRGGETVAFGPWGRRFGVVTTADFDPYKQPDAYHGPKAAWLFMSAANDATEILGSQGMPAVGEL